MLVFVGTIDGVEEDQMLYTKWARSPAIITPLIVVWTPVTHLFSAIYRAYNSIYN